MPTVLTSLMFCKASNVVIFLKVKSLKGVNASFIFFILGCLLNCAYFFNFLQSFQCSDVYKGKQFEGSQCFLYLLHTGVFTVLHYCYINRIIYSKSRREVGLIYSYFKLLHYIGKTVVKLSIRFID